MHSGRSAATGRRPPATPGERLVRRTGLGLAVFTLVLIAVLMAAVGFVTAAAAVQTANQSVDRNLRQASDNMMFALAEERSGESASPSPEPEEDEGSSGHGDDDHRTPVPTPRPTPTASPAPIGDQSPGSADTFYLVLDDNGALVSNPQRVPLGSGLPDEAAAAVAASGQEDWRTITVDNQEVRLFTQPMLNAEGDATGILQSGFVLTFQRDQTAQLVRTIILATAIGLLGAALVTVFVTRRAMAPIRAAFEAERRFVAAASHELRTPVAVVRASAEILQREELVKPGGERLVEDVIAESDRLGRLVGDLLALASAEAGQISMHPTLFDLRAVVDEAAARAGRLSQERGVAVLAVHEATEGGADLLVEADRERLLQLLMIFIDNAIDHSPANSIVRVVSRASDEMDRPRAVVEVTDEGPGVPAAERERIFEPFAKVSGRRRTTGTTGLGLSIARLLAARMDATLEVRDAPGGGAVFSVTLERQAPRARA